MKVYPRLLDAAPLAVHITNFKDTGYLCVMYYEDSAKVTKEYKYVVDRVVVERYTDPNGRVFKLCGYYRMTLHTPDIKQNAGET